MLGPEKKYTTNKPTNLKWQGQRSYFKTMNINEETNINDEIVCYVAV